MDRLYMWTRVRIFYTKGTGRITNWMGTEYYRQKSGHTKETSITIYVKAKDRYNLRMVTIR